MSYATEVRIDWDSESEMSRNNCVLLVRIHVKSIQDWSVYGMTLIWDQRDSKPTRIFKETVAHSMKMFSK